MAIDESLTFVPINIALLTVSDTRKSEDDTSGNILAEKNHVQRSHSFEPRHNPGRY